MSGALPIGPHEDQAYIDAFPFIDWDRPQPVSSARAHGYGCRLCIAKFGLAESKIAELPQTPEEWEQHMHDEHPTVKVA